MPSRPWVRFWARVIDSIPMTVLVEFIAPAIGIPADTWSNYASAWISMAVWIPIEAFLLSTWGTTPGKFVLDIRLRGDLSMGNALSRSGQVFLKGFAAGIPFVGLLAIWRSYRRLKNHGRTAWDESTGVAVEHGPVTWWRVALAILLILVSLGLEATTMNAY